MMTFKYQILRLKFPEEIYQITLNHLNSLLLILLKNEKENENVIVLVKENIDYFQKVFQFNYFYKFIFYFEQTYGRLSPYEYITLKQTILRFFQGRNVKVSIFIQDGLQSIDGVIQLFMREQSPPGVNMPGKVVKYNLQGETVEENMLAINTAAFYEKNESTERIKIISTALGENIYDTESKATMDKNKIHPTTIDRNDNKTFNLSGFTSENNSPNVKMNVEKFPVKNNNMISDDTQRNSMIQDISYYDDEKRKVNVDYLKKEFGQLADLLNVPTKRNDDDETFKIELFKMRAGDKFTNKANEDYEVYIEVERENNNLDRIRSMFDDMKVEEERKDDDDDDLLDLMDK